MTLRCPCLRLYKLIKRRMVVDSKEVMTELGCSLHTVHVLRKRFEEEGYIKHIMIGRKVIMFHPSLSPEQAVALISKYRRELDGKIS